MTIVRIGAWNGEDIFGFPAPQLVITLQPRAGHPKRCSRCGEIVEEIHDVTEREVRDVALMESETWLRFPQARLRCPRCGPTTEAVT